MGGGRGRVVGAGEGEIPGFCGFSLSDGNSKKRNRRSGVYFNIAVVVDDVICHLKKKEFIFNHLASVVSSF